jgi:glycine C-acetyltransferase
MALQKLCREYDATLLVDVAHDLGNIGEEGRGFIGMQNMLGKIDIVMGSFSKTFGSNGGFVSCNSPAVKQYLKFYGCSNTFSNALSPVQAATVTKAFEIIQSDQGRNLRRQMMDRVMYLRAAFDAAGLELIGNPSAIVPVIVGDEALARMVARRLPDLGVVANLVEFPAVAKGNARFRFQVMPNHSHEHLDQLVERFSAAVHAAKSEYERYLRSHSLDRRRRESSGNGSATAIAGE